MNPLPKSLLLPIDDQEETLRPIDFLVQLYPRRDHISLILSYLESPLAPVYLQKPLAPAMLAKKKALLLAREAKTREVLNLARKTLVQDGFPEDEIQQHVQEKELSVAHHACRLADLKKVDAVVIQRRFSSRLEAFFKGDISAALLNHCQVSPIWFVDGEVKVERAVIGLDDAAASRRAVDHAAFMLAETSLQIELLHLSRTLSQPFECTAVQFDTAAPSLRGTSGELHAVLKESLEILVGEGVAPERITLAVLPSKGKIAQEILRHCRQRQAGILVLGHQGSAGTWNFLKNSVAKAVLAEANNLAVWVNQ